MSPETSTRTVVVTNRHGLHARPALVIVKTVQGYDAQVTIRRGNQIVDAASILDLLSLGAAQGTELVLSAKGRQAKDAIEALAQQFDTEFEIDYKGQ
ncbi:MAG: HPr family phosphocarrier protein [Thermoguttaceae bacterium]